MSESLQGMLTETLRKAGVPAPGDIRFVVRLLGGKVESVEGVPKALCQELKFVGSFEVEETEVFTRKVTFDKPQKCGGPLPDDVLEVGFREQCEAWRAIQGKKLCGEAYLALGCVYAWMFNTKIAKECWQDGKKAEGVSQGTKDRLCHNIGVVQRVEEEHGGDLSNLLGVFADPASVEKVQDVIGENLERIRDSQFDFISMIE